MDPWEHDGISDAVCVTMKPQKQTIQNMKRELGIVQFPSYLARIVKIVQRFWLVQDREIKTFNSGVWWLIIKFVHFVI